MRCGEEHKDLPAVKASRHGTVQVGWGGGATRPASMSRLADREPAKQRSRLTIAHGPTSAYRPNRRCPATMLQFDQPVELHLGPDATQSPSAEGACLLHTADNPSCLSMPAAFAAVLAQKLAA